MKNKTRLEENAIVLKQDVVSALHHVREKLVELIYVDPPYNTPLTRDILSALSEKPYVTPETTIILETSLDYGIIIARKTEPFAR